VLGSRILGGYALKGGMPVWKYIANRFLTFVENILIGAKLSEYHTGYRAFSRELLEQLPLNANSNNFVFDNQMLAQIVWLGCTIAEISCPTKYFTEASSINLSRSIQYGFGCLHTALTFRLAKMNFITSNLFPNRTARNFSYNMTIAFLLYRSVSFPPICFHFTSRLNIVLFKRNQVFFRSIRNASEANSPKLILHFFNRDNYQCLFNYLSTSAPFFFTSNIGFINFDRSMQTFSTWTYHNASKFMQPSPGCLIAAESKAIFQIFSACSCLLRYKPPHYMEPQSQWFSSILKYCSSGNRSLMSTVGTMQQIPIVFPSLSTLTTRTKKTIWPSNLENIVKAIIFCLESVNKFFKILWIIFLYHLVSPEKRSNNRRYYILW